jgi:hypothetical protein
MKKYILPISFFCSLFLACEKQKMIVEPSPILIENKSELEVILPSAIVEGENVVYKGKATGKITTVEIFFDNAIIGTSKVENNEWSFSFKHSEEAKDKTLQFKGLDDKNIILQTRTYTVEIAAETVLTNDIVKDMPYFYQYSNQDNPSGTCQNTCLAMVLKYFANLEGKITFASSITPDILTATWGNKKAQTVPGLQDVFNQEASKNGLKIRGTGTTTEPLASFRAIAKLGKPMIVHGYFTAYGHILVVLGFDGTHYICNDPAGKWSQQYQYGGYSTTNNAEGITVKYGKEAFEKAISPDGMVWMHTYK